MKRFVAGVVILWRVFVAIGRSGWQISWRILRPSRSFAPGFVEYRFQPMGPAATTVLACLICITPGTTAVDVDAANGSMRLHLLDAGHGDAVLEEIRLLFEGAVRTLFAKEDVS
ncbi:Na+/H+ antiporter subunit E [Massilia sp. GCM10020059]|uniref:Na+/H+ antiporter subunit E n=1 Tax=Massilia agrisoli TaxID=2892444 RepID=A0ABS8IVQ9_9BURK|nr:Na+/H+ antiporter subunit E [Massilia agrisoli]MCC6071943.1 Na+/H+ antiporter subunit E [Massilia agrisoli]